tara:strand:- start:101 stop:1135 length:1035 start_codon:yes stop_codon:yes gene_type:complete
MAKIGNWIDRLKPNPQEIGSAALDKIKGVRIAPNSNAIRAMFKAQQLKKVAGRFSPRLVEDLDDIIRKSEEFLGTRIPHRRYDPPEILTKLGTFNGPLQGNKFVVIIPPPPKNASENWFVQYSANKVDPWQHFKFVVQSTSLPNTSISTNPIDSPGPEVLMPYEVSYDDISLEMICTVGDVEEDFTGLPEKRFFDAWMSNIIDPFSMEIGYRNQYVLPKMIIQVFGPHDLKVPIMTVFLENCYPISMDAVELSHDNNDLIKINVSIHFEKWSYYGVDEGKLKTFDAPQPLKHQEQQNHAGSRKDYISDIYSEIEKTAIEASKNIPENIKDTTTSTIKRLVNKVK